MIGKALHATAVNRTGARLMGIRPARSGAIAYLLGSLMAGVSGILIAPVNTIFYDSGFLIGLKAFVGAIIGGLVSYPGAAMGALLRRHARKLRGVPEQRVQGRHRVFAADSRADLALDRLRARPRKTSRNERVGPRSWPRFSPSSRYWRRRLFVSAFAVTLLNYIGVYALVAIGLVLLTGIGGVVSFGQAAFVGVGRLCDGLGDDDRRPIALARLGARDRGDLRGRGRRSAA